MTEEEFAELVGVAIGSASMAWDEIPVGVFDSTKCAHLIRVIVSAAKDLRPS